MQADPISQMDKLLAAEKLALMTADYDALASLGQLKADTLAALTRHKSSKKALARIKQRMDENQVLLAAAIGGVAAARNRIDALHNVQKGLKVYDHSGKLEIVSAKRCAVEKKA